ncbi:hypothetical protein RUND412_007461 [Rhizina undulata]
MPRSPRARSKSRSRERRHGGEKGRSRSHRYDDDDDRRSRRKEEEEEGRRRWRDRERERNREKGRSRSASPPRGESGFREGKDRDRYRDRDRDRDRNRDRDPRDRKSSRPISTTTPKPPFLTGANASTSTPDPPIEKESANFNQTGLLAAASNTVNGVALKYSEPVEARKPPGNEQWKLFVFKDKEIIDTIDLNRESCWLIGRDRAVVDLPVDHPSCSKQHAVLQFRFVNKVGEFGDRESGVRPYLIDLESANGTLVNKEEVPKSRFVELKQGDLIMFGLSTSKTPQLGIPARNKSFTTASQEENPPSSSKFRQFARRLANSPLLPSSRKKSFHLPKQQRSQDQLPPRSSASSSVDLAGLSALPELVREKQEMGSSRPGSSHRRSTSSLQHHLHHNDNLPNPQVSNQSPSPSGLEVDHLSPRLPDPPELENQHNLHPDATSVQKMTSPFDTTSSRQSTVSSPSRADYDDDGLTDMSLPLDQRRHLMEMEGSFRIDSDFSVFDSTPEIQLPTPPNEGGASSTSDSGRIGGMGPPPLPTDRRGLQRSVSSVSRDSWKKSNNSTRKASSGSNVTGRDDIFGRDVESLSLKSPSPLPSEDSLKVRNFSTVGARSGSASSQTSQRSIRYTTPHNPQTPFIPSSDFSNSSGQGGNYENLVSSPTVAAQARSISRVNSANSVNKPLRSTTASGNSSEKRATPSPIDFGRPSLERKSSVNSSKTEPNYGSLGGRGPAPAIKPSRSHRSVPSTSTILAPHSSTTASTSYKKRPKFIRSRSQRSSVSSNADMHGGTDDDGSTITAGEGLGGGVLSRSTSLGSIASGVSGIGAGTTPIGDRSISGVFTSAAEKALARLDEEEKKSRHGSPDSDEAEPSTPKFRQPPLPQPTETVITARVKNIQIPPTIAKDFLARQLGPPLMAGSPAKRGGGPGTTPAPGQGKNMTLKEQSAIIDRLQKENFDLKIKIFYLNDRLEKQSEEGVKEMMTENVEMKVKLAEAMRERKSLKKKIRELEKRIEEMGGEKKDEAAEEGTDSEEIWELREKVERYELEIEELRSREKERMQKMKDQAMNGTANGKGSEEVEMLREFLETETTRREQVDLENRRLRDEIWRLKNEPARLDSSQSTNTTTNTRRTHSRSISGRDSSRERGLVDQLRQENEELRREVGAQTSMLTSRNREKERLYQEIEELKLHMRNGGSGIDNRPQSMLGDRILERSVSRAGAASVAGTHITILSDAEREDFENANGALRDRISELKLKNHELELQLENCYRELDARGEEVERALHEYEEEIEMAHAEVQEMQADRNDALKMREEMELDFEQLKEEAEEEIQRLEEEIEARSGELERMEEEGRCREEDFKGLQAELRSVSDIVVRLEDAQEEHLNEVRRLEEKIVDLERTIQENEQEMTVLEGSLREASEKVERLTVQAESAQGEIAFLREEQEGDKIKIGELESVIKTLEKSVQDEKERAKEVQEQLEEERKEREERGDLQEQEWERKMNEKNQEVSNLKEEIRKLKSKVSTREEEAKQWREKLEELERSLREAMGDLSGTKSGLLKSIIHLKSELESTLEELEDTKAELTEKDRVLKDRENLLETMALETRKLTDLLDKERAGRKTDKAAYENLQSSHHQTKMSITKHESKYTELEKAKNKEHKSLNQLENQYRDQLTERNNLLTQIWQRLSVICGSDWASKNSIVTAVTGGKQSMEAAIVSSLPGFARNLFAAIKTIENIIGGFKARCRGVERDLWKEYQVIENALETRTRRLERLENLVRGGIGEQSGMRTEVAKLRTENRMLKAELHSLKDKSSPNSNALQRSGTSASMTTTNSSIAASSSQQDSANSGSTTQTVLTKTSSSTQIVQAEGSVHDANGERKWIMRLRELEKRLKQEREARLLDRSAAKKKVEEARGEKEELKAELERERIGKIEAAKSSS